MNLRRAVSDRDHLTKVTKSQGLSLSPWVSLPYADLVTVGRY